jgi:hypothetical protein
MTSSSITPLQLTGVDFTQYKEEELNTAFSKLPKTEKIRILASLSLSSQSEITFEFCKDLPEELLSRILSTLPTQTTIFLCHAVCKRFFHNSVVTEARKEVADDVFRRFMKKKPQNFGHLTTELKAAVRNVQFNQTCLYFDKQLFAHLPSVQAITIVKISCFCNFSWLKSFPLLETLELYGLDKRDTEYDEKESIVSMPNSIKNLILKRCSLKNTTMQQLAHRTSLQSLTIIDNDGNLEREGEIGDDLDSSEFSYLPKSLTYLNLPHTDIKDCSCFAHLQNLQILKLANLDESWSLSQLPVSLIELHLPGTDIEDCSCFAHLQNLQILSLMDLDDSKNLSQLPLSLTDLHTCCSLSITKFRELTHLQNLKIVKGDVYYYDAETTLETEMKQLPPWMVEVLRRTVRSVQRTQLL